MNTNSDEVVCSRQVLISGATMCVIWRELSRRAVEIIILVERSCLVYVKCQAGIYTKCIHLPFAVYLFIFLFLFLFYLFIFYFFLGGGGLELDYEVSAILYWGRNSAF